MPADTTTRRTLAATASAGVLALLVSGCASGASSAQTSTGQRPEPTASAATTGGGAAQVDVTLTSAGGTDACNLGTTSVPAGPVTFTVTNQDSAAITEVELLSEDRILGEKENLAPGLAPVSFTVTLGGGAYQVYCPGAAQDLVDFTVTGEAAPTPTGGVQALLKDGTQGYAAYVTGVVADMVTAVATFTDAVASGDVDAAKEAYAKARPFYERIESDVEGFVLDGFEPTDNRGNLDYLIDMRASSLDPAVGWHGFHAIERDLWERGEITARTKRLATELTHNVGLLADVTSTLTYQPEDLANGATTLLEEVQSGKITGEEELYSHLDLVDFAGNVEGAEQAFAFLRPGLTEIDPDLTAKVAAGFDDVKALLATYQDPDALGGYLPYTAKVRAKDAPTLSRAIQALLEPFSTIAEKVATAR